MVIMVICLRVELLRSVNKSKKGQVGTQSDVVSR